MLKLSLTFALAGASLFAAAPQAKPAAPQTKSADAAIEAQIATEIQLLRSDVKTMSRTLLTDGLELSAPEAAAFWPIYDEYELAATKLDDVRLGTIKSYLDNFDTMTPAMTEDISKRVFKFQIDRIKLSESYFKRVSKAVSAQKAARFIQIDTAIRNVKDLQIQARMPLFK